MTEQGKIIKTDSDYEGLQTDVRDWKTPVIETFENQYSDRFYEVTLNCGNGELTSVCPKTGLPDFATLKVTYRPSKKCIELKSFKEYLLFYRDKGIFHEHLTNRIADDLKAACDPISLTVTVYMNPRGNIQTVVEVKRYKGLESSEED